ncbi:MAG TPA: hypothetical protein VJA19_18050 [Pseudomonas sp.]|nr:hypothetical protein [Pseudomonas sp.]
MQDELIFLLVGCFLLAPAILAVAGTGKMQLTAIGMIVVALTGLFILNWPLLLNILFVIFLALCGMLALVLIPGLIGGFADKKYTDKFPAFKSAPIKIITSPKGYTYKFHIVKIENYYITGLEYDIWVDGGIEQARTRWTLKFPDYASADRDLNMRAHHMMANELFSVR